VGGIWSDPGPDSICRNWKYWFYTLTILAGIVVIGVCTTIGVFAYRFVKKRKKRSDYTPIA
jgi:hypothetical protein